MSDDLLSPESSLSSSSLETLTVSELKRVIRELEETHLITPEPLGSWDRPPSLFLEHLAEDTPEMWKVRYSYAQIAARNFPWWIGASVIGETSKRLTLRELWTYRMLPGRWLRMRRWLRESSRSLFTWMRLLPWRLRYFFQTRVW